MLREWTVENGSDYVIAGLSQREKKKKKKKKKEVKQIFKIYFHTDKIRYFTIRKKNSY